MKNLIAFIALLMCIICAQADEKPDNEPQPSSLIDTAFCYISPEPWNCVRNQAGRMLDYLQAKVKNKRVQLLVEADEEAKKSEVSRKLSGDEEHQQLPSEIISNLDKGFWAIAKIIRQRRSLKKEGGRSEQIEDMIVDDTSDSIIGDEITSLDDGDDDDEGNLAPNEARGKETNTEIRQNTNLQGFGGYDDDVTYFGGYKGSKRKVKKGKKGKKGLMKLFFLGTLIKSKIELLLKVLSFKLQIKFLLIAAVNLVINLARFWIDLKKVPQKVVVVEHSQHQHHYDNEEHDWNSGWKRQTNTAQNQQEYNGDFAHRIAYNGYPAVPGVTY